MIFRRTFYLLKFDFIQALDIRLVVMFCSVTNLNNQKFQNNLCESVGTYELHYIFFKPIDRDKHF